MNQAILVALCLGGAMLVQAQSPVETGRQLYRANCQACHGPEGDNVAGVNFKSGEFRHASSDDDLARLILNGIPGTAMPPTNLPENSRRAIVAYLRSMHAATMGGSSTGDPARGMAIFNGKGGCLNCHSIRGEGSRLGPDLSDIGSQRAAAAIEKSIVAPNDVILPQNRFVQLTLKDGSVITGRRLNEDTYTIQLIDQKQRLVSVSRDDVREYVLVKTSPMPSYEGKLSAEEISDLVAYLVSLKGAQ